MVYRCILLFYGAHSLQTDYEFESGGLNFDSFFNLLLLLLVFLCDFIVQTVDAMPKLSHAMQN